MQTSGSQPTLHPLPLAAHAALIELDPYGKLQWSSPFVMVHDSLG